jgi:hypothetical protein
MRELPIRGLGHRGDDGNTAEQLRDDHRTGVAGIWIALLVLAAVVVFNVVAGGSTPASGVRSVEEEPPAEREAG